MSVLHKLSLCRVLALVCLSIVTLNSGMVVADSGSSLGPENEFGQYRYMIEFAETGLLDRHTARGTGERFDFDSPRIRAEIHDLMTTHDIYQQAMVDNLNRSLDVTHYFLITHSGLAVWLEPGEAERVRQMEGVVSVERERIYDLATYRGPTFMGADDIWNGSAVPDGSALRGEGMIVGILDTGIPVAYGEHASFANDPACGHGEGGTADKVLSSVDCGSTDASGLCNGSNPGDTNGHGSHVASTAAGNRIDASAAPAPNIPGSFSMMSGVAPCAHIRAYKVCPGNTCPEPAIQAGLSHILAHDDADVMNFSISGGRDPWNDNDRRKLDLVTSGILVAAAAGNTGPAIPNPVGQVGHLGPWVMTVAASSRDTNDNGGSAKGDVLAGFSLRGPTPTDVENLQKPDITAPGVRIYAASIVNGNASYAFLSGTSMASPHAAGAATLVRQARPSWTPAEVKSAMMMSSSTGGTKENGSAPWDADDVGSGRVDLTVATKAGLVMDETTANYLAADPASDGDVRTLNIPAVRDLDCSPSCSWTRTVRNTLSVASTWTAQGNVLTPSEGFEITIEPEEFSFNGNSSETQEVTITATPVANQLGLSVGFGEVVLTETGGNSPDLHITVAINGEGSPDSDAGSCEPAHL